MELNFEEIFNGMLSVFSNNLKEGGEEAITYGQKVLTERKAGIENISKAFAKRFENLIKQYESELEDEKTTLQSQLLAGEVIAKSTAQKAINETMDFLVGAIKRFV
jgi:hypothetical protein